MEIFRGEVPLNANNIVCKNKKKCCGFRSRERKKRMSLIDKLTNFTIKEALVS